MKKGGGRGNNLNCAGDLLLQVDVCPGDQTAAEAGHPASTNSQIVLKKLQFKTLNSLSVAIRTSCENTTI